MSEKYYRDINSNKDIIKFKLQLGAILLKLNENNLNISNIGVNITELDTAIENNDKDIKSNYDICIGNSNNLADIDRKIYAINNNITEINSDIEGINGNITNINSDIENIEESNKNIIKHKYSIENIWLYNIDILNTYIIDSSSVNLFECYIEGDFVTNSILEIYCNVLYKYGSYNDIGLLKHIYSLIDANDNIISTHSITHANSGDNYTNHLTMNDSFSILFKNSHTSKLKIRLQLGKASTNSSKAVGLRIMNPYNSNIIRIKHINIYLKNNNLFKFNIQFHITVI